MSSEAGGSHIQTAVDIASQELGFAFPQDTLTALGNHEKFQTFGHVDAVYYPSVPERDDVDLRQGLAMLPHLFEEHIHLHQFRRSSAGWSLELLSREFCALVPPAERGARAGLRQLQAARDLLNAYGESMRDPLELEARYLTVLYLVMWSDERLRRGFLEAFSLDDSNPPACGTAFEEWFANSLQDWIQTLKKSAQSMSERYESYPKWLHIVSEALAQTANLFWKKSEIPERDYLEQIGNCLEILTLPCVAALMPRHRPTEAFRNTTSDPSRRLEIACSCMLTLSPQDVRQGEIGGAMRRISGAMPTLDKWTILSMRNKAAASISSAPEPEVPLLPLRVVAAALDDDLQDRFIPASELDGSLADDGGPTILVRRDEDGSVSIDLLVEDAIGRHFSRQFDLYLKGLAILREIGQ